MSVRFRWLADVHFNQLECLLNTESGRSGESNNRKDGHGGYIATLMLKIYYTQSMAKRKYAGKSIGPGS